MSKKPLCIYHGNCADGFTSAWAVWRKHGEEFDYFAGIYGEEPPDVLGRDVYLVDFSYKRDVLQDMATRARSIIVLDHHKTAQADLAPFTDIGLSSCLEEEVVHLKFEGKPAIAARFDMDKSGAMLAWEHFHPGKAAPELVRYVQDRDLWRFALPGSREVSAYIFAHEYTFENWDYLRSVIEPHEERQNVIYAGAAIEKKHHKDVAELVAKSKRRMDIGGVSVPVANLPYTMSSDAGHLMAQGEPFAACYFDTATHRIFSLRSADDGMDVSEIAAAQGGGGHARAAGFQLPLSEAEEAA